MMLSDSDKFKFARALSFCKEAHGDQKRKYTGTPYWTHPYSVAMRLRAADFSVDVQIAGLLHDTREDTDCTFIEIEKHFGGRVANWVEMVTDKSKPEDGNREFRKRIDLEHLARADYFGKSIKLADLIDNTHSIVKYDKDFARVYLREKEKLLCVLSDGHHGLFKHAEDVLSLSMQILEAHDDAAKARTIFKPGSRLNPLSHYDRD